MNAHQLMNILSPYDTSNNAYDITSSYRQLRTRTRLYDSSDPRPEDK
jgi:hypothetical protein